MKKFLIIALLMSISVLEMQGLELTDKLKLSGDVRFRSEQDWNSQKSDGSFRKDRSRLRYRLRFGFNYKWSDFIQFGGRIRSGNPSDQQSPHNTIGSEMEPGSFSIDKAFISGKYDMFWWNLGKSSFPFWKQNELFWDDDVIPEGASFGGNFKTDKFQIRPAFGAFIINTSSNFFGTDSKLIAGQIAIKGKLSSVNIEFGTGIYIFDKLPTQNDGTSEEVIDYNIFNSGLKLGFDIGLPLSFGFDYMINLTDYSKDKYKDIVPDQFKEEKTGFIANITLGSLKNEGEWLIGYYYTQLAKYSVVDYLAQDDWLRWTYNGATGARSSNFGGHEFRLAYSFGKGFNCVLRTYLVDALVKKGGDTDKALESANRLRLDFNIKF